MTDFATELALFIHSELRSPLPPPEIAQKIRDQYGAERRRISVIPRPSVSIEAIDAGLRERKTVRELAREFGVGRDYIYRRLRKQPKPS